MTGADVALIITSISTLLTTIGGLVAVFNKVKSVDDKVEVVHKATNSLVTQLVETTAAKEHAAGVKQGEATAKVETGRMPQRATKEI